MPPWGDFAAERDGLRAHRVALFTSRAGTEEKLTPEDAKPRDNCRHVNHPNVGATPCP